MIHDWKLHMNKQHLAPALSSALALALGAMLCLPEPVFAQEALQEILVTAQRRKENVQDVPIAVTALSSADLQGRGIRQAADIAAAVPNLQLSLPYGEEAQPTFALRGVTTNDWSQNQSSPIAMYVDDVYKSVGAIQALQTYDLDRVEVLRGPQGTLYGKNATGGAINFYSKNPSLTGYDGYLTAGVGNYSNYYADAAVGGPIVDGVLGWRAAVYYDKRDGWVRSVVPGVEPLNGIDAAAGRFTLLFRPNDDLSVLLKVAVSKSGGTPYGAKALNNDPTVTGFSGDYGWFNSGAKYAIHKQIRDDGGSLKVDWRFADHYALTTVTGFDYGLWYERSDDGALATTDSGVAIHIDDPNLYSSSINAFSQEVRIESRDLGKLAGLLGVYYGRDDTHGSEQFHFFDSYPGTFVLPSGQTLYGFDQFNSFDQIRVSKAGFLNLTYALTPAVNLRAGVRYTKDSITIDNFYALEGGLTSQPLGLGPDTVPTMWTQTIPTLPTTYTLFQSYVAPQGATNPPIGQGNSNVSSKVGVDWKVTDNVLTYASFSQGYRGAAFNGQAFNNPVELTFANPEKLNAYEIGEKSELLNRRLEINGAIFYYQYRDQQFLDTFALPNNLGTGFHTVNAPRSRIAGAELDVRARPTAALSLQANLGVLNTKYQELFLHGADRSGNQLIMAPKLSAGALMDWRAYQMSSGDLHLELDGNFYTKQYYDALNTERIAQPSYGIFNGRITFVGRSNPQMSVALWAKNLANRHYLTYGLAQRNPSDGGLGFDYVLVGEPRTYGLELTIRM